MALQPDLFGEEFDNLSNTKNSLSLDDEISKYSENIVSLISCPNCGNDTIFGNCENCGYCLADIGDSIYNKEEQISDSLDSFSKRELESKNRSDSQQGNGEKIKIDIGDNIYFYNYFGCIEDKEAHLKININGIIYKVNFEYILLRDNEGIITETELKNIEISEKNTNNNKFKKIGWQKRSKLFYKIKQISIYLIHDMRFNKSL